jgi:RNA polymerase primary sigma factor
MFEDKKLPNLVDLYVSEIKRFESFSKAQQFWLGIVIDAERMLKTLIKDKNLDYEKDCDYLYIGVLNKIREAYDKLESSTLPKVPPLINYISKTIEEIIEFKQTSKPVRKSILGDFFDSLPDHYHTQLFDLIDYLWILPSPILNFYQLEISEKNKLPSLAQVLIILNPLDTVYETKLLQDRNRYAKEMLIEGFLRHVKYYAYKYRKLGLDDEDVIQVGNLGLMKAVDKYDVRVGAQFITHALWWIRQTIFRAIADDSRTIRFPVHLHDKINKLLRTQRVYMVDHYAEPSVKVLAEMTGFSVDEVSGLIELTKQNRSLTDLELCEANFMRNYLTTDYHPGLFPCINCPWIPDDLDEDVDSEYVDFVYPLCLVQDSLEMRLSKSDLAFAHLKKITSREFEDELNNIELEELKAIIDKELSTLSPRASKLINIRFGLSTREYLTLDEVGQKFGVTRERVRQIEQGEFDHLRRSRALKSAWDDYQSDK